MREVAANLDVPWVVELADVALIVEEAVSMAFAEKYVPVYSVFIMVSKDAATQKE